MKQEMKSNEKKKIILQVMKKRRSIYKHYCDKYNNNFGNVFGRS